MIVWTQQRLSFLDDLQRNGVVFCTEESDMYEDCGFAYDWLVAQMHTRLLPPPIADIKLPLWCWVQYNNYKSRKPKFTPSKDENGYYAEVFIEADIPDNLLLQSDFYLWSWYCLNGWEIGNKQLHKEWGRFIDENFAGSGFRFYDLPADMQCRIKKSWEHIFDLDYRNHCYRRCSRRNKSIQATFWLLRKEWVREVRIFTPEDGFRVYNWPQ